MSTKWTFPVRKTSAPLPRKRKVAAVTAIPRKEPDSFAEWRLKGIGGSDAPVIMGATPKEWGTILDLWKLKTGRAEPQEPTYPMKRGLALEPIAREVYEAKTGVLMPADRAIHPKFDFIRGNFDGVNWDLGKILEIKCPGIVDHQVAIEGRIPDKYIWQCVHLLLVTGLDQLDYFSFDGKEGIIVHFKRDSLLEEQLLENEIPFWDCVQKNIPPKEKERIVSQQKKNEVEISPKELVEFLTRAKALGVTSLTLNLNGENKGYDLSPKKNETIGFCEYHQVNYVEGTYGEYCKECYIDRKNRRR